MPAEELLKQGDLQGALEELQQAVRGDPADAALRVFLFQLLSVAGNWERALTQLNVSGDLDSQALPMVQAYREALRCEALRDDVYAGKRQPLVFGQPERWIALAFEALKLTVAGKLEAAADMRAQAYEDVPETSGTLNGEPFAWVADGDTRVGPFLEAIVNGGYYWVPMHRLSKVEIEEPSDLRDFVWAPAAFTWANGGEAVGFIPSRYPGSLADTEAEFLLCRRTEWRELDEQTFLGVGQRVLMTDTGEHSLLDIRVLELNSDSEDDSEGNNDNPDGGEDAASS